MKESRFLINSLVDSYCEEHTTDEGDVLESLTRETNLKALMPRMLSGKVQGRFLTLLVKILRPKVVLELGTFTGYSAICMANGLTDEGKLITIDKNPEIEDMARKYFKAAGVEDKITFLIGDAFKIVSELDETFDLAFLDADKERLLDYYELVVGKMNRGGIMLVDNILWDGKVVDNACRDKVTEEIRAFNDFVQADGRVENALLPLRDGLMMIRKING